MSFFRGSGMPVQELVAMLLHTLINLFASFLVTTASVIIAIRFQKWHTLLMAVGAILSLCIRIGMNVVGYMQTANVISTDVYHTYTDIFGRVGTATSLAFAIGFLATAMYMLRQFAPSARKDLTSL